MPYLLEKKVISDFATTICLRVAVAVTRHSSVLQLNSYCCDCCVFCAVVFCVYC